jgi:tetratricopeptide (TPR) repeat protein
MAAALLPEVLQPESDKAQQKLTPRADASSASTEPDGPEQRARLRFSPIRFPGSWFRQALKHSRTFSSGAWKSLPAYLSFYLLLIVAGYAAWEAQTPVTIIAPFQLPKADLPFSGDIVADTLQDSLTSIHADIERESQDPGLRSSWVGLPDLRNMLIPKFGRVQVPPRFAVEVKGLSYEGIISVARAVIGTETTVSGDLILNGNELILIARTSDAGPWESVSSPISAAGLKRASRDLAEKILATKDPTLAGVALLKDGEVDKGLAVLERARSLNPTDVRLKLNLCKGFGANRRYQEAIECYEDVLTMNPSSAQEVSERLAQIYYLKGDREIAIQRYEELYKQGYRAALLGLAEALDDTGQHEGALKAYNEFLAVERRDRNLAIALVNRGTALSRVGKHDEALTEYRKALRYAPGDVLILANIGVELAQAGDLDAGIAQLQSVVDENANADSVPFAFLQLGILFQQKGDWRRAGDEFRRATELWPNYVEAHLRLAYALAHEGHRTEALSEYNRVARLSGYELDRRYSQVFANQWLGNALRDQGKYAAAASAYHEAIRLEPDYGMAHCELGFVLEKLGHTRQAIQEYRAALLAVKSKVFDPNKWIVLAHQRLEEALVSEGRARRAEAIVERRKAIELDRKLGQVGTAAPP